MLLFIFNKAACQGKLLNVFKHKLNVSRSIKTSFFPVLTAIVDKLSEEIHWGFQPWCRPRNRADSREREYGRREYGRDYDHLSM